MLVKYDLLARAMPFYREGKQRSSLINIACLFKKSPSPTVQTRRAETDSPKDTLEWVA